MKHAKKNVSICVTKGDNSLALSICPTQKLRAILYITVGMLPKGIIL